MEDRLIYSYFDGEKTVHADPLQVLRDLRYHAGQDPYKLSETASKSYPDQKRAEISENDFREGMEAERVLLEAIRKTFGLAEFDRSTGKGLLLEQVKSIWNDFCRFLSQKKTSGPPSPTSATHSPA